MILFKKLCNFILKSISLWFCSKTFWYCYQTQVQLLTTQKPIVREASVGSKKTALIRKASNLVRRMKNSHSLVLRPTPKILLSRDRFSREKWGKNLSELSRQEVGFCFILHGMQTGWRSSDVILPAWSACRIA